MRRIRFLLLLLELNAMAAGVVRRIGKIREVLPDSSLITVSLWAVRGAKALPGSREVIGEFDKALFAAAGIPLQPGAMFYYLARDADTIEITAVPPKIISERALAKLRCQIELEMPEMKQF